MHPAICRRRVDNKEGGSYSSSSMRIPNTRWMGKGGGWGEGIDQWVVVSLVWLTAGEEIYKRGR